MITWASESANVRQAANVKKSAPTATATIIVGGPALNLRTNGTACSLVRVGREEPDPNSASDQALSDCNVQRLSAQSHSGGTMLAR